MDKIKKLKQTFLKLKEDVSKELTRVNVNQNSHIQNYLYFIHYPIFSFAESIIILCENNKPHVAKVLLRSLFEAHINIIFHQVSDTEKALAISAKTGFDLKIKNIKELKKLIAKHPNLESKDNKNLFNNNWLDEALEWSKTQRSAIIKGGKLNHTDTDLDLKSKAIKCDKNSEKIQSPSGLEDGHFERMYQVIFRQLSSTSHLNMEGIQTFISQNETGEYLFEDGEDGHFIAEQALEITLAFIKDLYDNKVITENIPESLFLLEK